MGRIETNIGSTKNKKIAASDRYIVNDANSVVFDVYQNIKLKHRNFSSENSSQREEGLPSGFLVDKQEFGRAMDAFTSSVRTMADHVHASIEPLCFISAMGDRIDRLNRENAEALDKLINGRP